MCRAWHSVKQPGLLKYSSVSTSLDVSRRAGCYSVLYTSSVSRLATCQIASLALLFSLLKDFTEDFFIMDYRILVTIFGMY